MATEECLTPEQLEGVHLLDEREITDEELVEWDLELQKIWLAVIDAEERKEEPEGPPEDY